MSKARDGDTVKVHYTGKLESGEVFDSSEDQPLEFTIGSGTLIPGFEKGVIGMDVGDTKTIQISPDEAYGERRDELVVEVNKNDFPDTVTPALGQRLQIRQPGSDPIVVTITKLTEETVTLDANHPLAGYTLFFDVEMVAVS